MYLEFLSGFIAVKVGLSITKSLPVFARCIALGRVLLRHTIPVAILNVNALIEPLFGLMRSLDQGQKPNWPNYLPSLGLCE